MRFRFLLAFLALSFPLSVIAARIDAASFGARGDGRTDNTDAFQRLSEWARRNPGSTISFAPGTYLAGRQGFTRNSPYGSWYVDALIELTKVRNITLEGNGATLKYVPGLKYGTFNQQSGRPMQVTMPYLERQNTAMLGEAIMIKESAGVVVNNLNLDGNINAMVIGGKFGDIGWQISHRGVYIINSKNVTLRRMTIKDFGLDGVTVENNTRTSSSPDNILIDYLTAVRNGRLGLAWTGGRGLKITNSDFSYNATGKIRSNPAAGIDIEPEGGNICSNGVFENCRFTENTNIGFICDSGPLASKMTFTGCTFTNGNAYALLANGKEFEFRNCTVKGVFMPGGKTPETSVRYVGCTFIDYQSADNKDGSPSRFLIEGGGGAVNYSFTNSKFYVYRRKLAFLDPLTSDARYMPRFEGNTIYIFSKQQPETEYVSIMKRTMFLNNKVVDSTNLRPGKYYYFQFEGNGQTKGNTLIPRPNGTLRWHLNSPSSGKPVRM